MIVADFRFYKYLRNLREIPLLRISNPQSLKRLGHFLTPDFKSGGTPSGKIRVIRA